MLSSKTKRWLVLARVLSSASDTDKVTRGGRALDALYTGVPCAYCPAWPPLHPVKLAEVVPVHVTTPDAPNVMAFAPELKFDVLATPIVVLGSANGFPTS